MVLAANICHGNSVRVAIDLQHCVSGKWYGNGEKQDRVIDFELREVWLTQDLYPIDTFTIRQCSIANNINENLNIDFQSS